MRRTIAIVTVLLTLAAAGAAPAQITVIQTFSLPDGVDSGVQDVGWDGTSLWVADRETSSLLEIDPSDGSLLSQFSTPEDNPTGVASNATNLFSTNFGPGNSVDNLHEQTNLGALQNTWALPDSPTASAEGLAFDPGSGNLWHADNAPDPDRIYEIDPTTGNVVSSFPYPATDVGGLTWRDGRLIAIDETELVLYMMDTAGNVLGTASLASLGSRLRGLTWDGEYFWITRAPSDEEEELDLPATLYQVDVTFSSGDAPVPAPVLSGSGTIALILLLCCVSFYSFRRLQKRAPAISPMLE